VLAPPERWCQRSNFSRNSDSEHGVVSISSTTHQNRTFKIVLLRAEPFSSNLVRSHDWFANYIKSYFLLPLHKRVVQGLHCTPLIGGVTLPLSLSKVSPQEELSTVLCQRVHVCGDLEATHRRFPRAPWPQPHAFSTCVLACYLKRF
jgi:hypothetical protein